MAKKNSRLPATCWKPTRTLGKLQEAGLIPATEDNACIRAAKYGISLAQLLFIAFYIQGGLKSATAAYHEVRPDVTKKGASVAASEWLALENVQHALAIEVDRAFTRIAGEKQDVLEVICRVMHNDAHPQQMKAAELMGRYHDMWQPAAAVDININTDGGKTRRHIPLDERVQAALENGGPVVEGTAMAANEDIEDAEVET